MPRKLVLILVLLISQAFAQLPWAVSPNAAATWPKLNGQTYNAFPVGPFKLGNTYYLYLTTSNTHASDRAIQLLYTCPTSSDCSAYASWSPWAGANTCIAGDSAVVGCCESITTNSIGADGGLVLSDGVTLLLVGYTWVPAGAALQVYTQTATAAAPCGAISNVVSTSPSITTFDAVYMNPIEIPGGSVSSVFPSGAICFAGFTSAAGTPTYWLCSTDKGVTWNSRGQIVDAQAGKGCVGCYNGNLPNYECAGMSSGDNVQLACRWDFALGFQVPYSTDMGATWQNPAMQNLLAMVQSQPPTATSTIASSSLPAPTIVWPKGTNVYPALLLYSERNVWNKQGGGTETNSFMHAYTLQSFASLQNAIGARVGNDFPNRAALDITGNPFYSTTASGGVDFGYQGGIIQADGSLLSAWYGKSGTDVRIFTQKEVLLCGGSYQCGTGLSASGGMTIK